jgi:hypothetical protein
MLPRTGLYSDATPADKTHEPESIEGTTILTIPILLVSDDELQCHAIDRKKYLSHHSGRLRSFVLVRFSFFMNSWDMLKRPFLSVSGFIRFLTFPSSYFRFWIIRAARINPAQTTKSTPPSTNGENADVPDHNRIEQVDDVLQWRTKGKRKRPPLHLGKRGVYHGDVVRKHPKLSLHLWGFARLKSSRVRDASGYMTLRFLGVFFSGVF